MSRYLLNETKVFRCDTEAEAKTLLENIKKSNEVIDYRITHKVKKEEEYVILKVVVLFNEEKEPMITYTEEI